MSAQELLEMERRENTLAMLRIDYDLITAFVRRLQLLGGTDLGETDRHSLAGAIGRAQQRRKALDMPRDPNLEDVFRKTF